jgi:hypothetical protein
MGGSPTLAAPAHPAATSLAAPSPELAQASSKKGGGVAISPLLLPLNIVLPSFLSVSLAWLVSLRHGRRPSPVLVDWIWAWAGWIWWWRDGSGSPRPDLHRTVGSGGSASFPALSAWAAATELVVASQRLRAAMVRPAASVDGLRCLPCPASQETVGYSGRRFDPGCWRPDPMVRRPGPGGWWRMLAVWAAGASTSLSLALSSSPSSTFSLVAEQFSLLLPGFGWFRQ